MLQPFGRERKGRVHMAVMHGRHRGPRSAGIIRGVEVEPANVLPFPQASDAVELRHLRA